MRLSRIVKEFIGNIGSLYGVQLAGYVLPLVTVPFLTRTLGPRTWGTVAIAQAWAMFCQLLVEQGYSFSCGRAVSRSRHDLKAVSGLYAAAQSGKVLMALTALLATASVAGRIPGMDVGGGMLWWGAFFGIMQGLSASWLFIAMEEARGISRLEMASRGISVLMILWLVRTPADAWRVLAVQGGCSTLLSLGGVLLVRQRLGLSQPTAATTIQGLKEGAPFFFFRASENLYTWGPSMILAFFAKPDVVGEYAAAERLCRSFFVGGLDPINRIVYAKVQYLAGKSLAEAAEAVRTSAWVTGLLGVLSGLSAILLAPHLEWILGARYRGAEEPLQLLCVLPLAIALKWSLGLQWMVAANRERQLCGIVYGSAVFFLGATLLMARGGSSEGMAGAVALTELFVVTGILGYLRWQNLSPFTLMKNRPLT